MAGATLREHKWDEGTRLGHDGAIDYLIGFLVEYREELRLIAVGHRVVHGGTKFSEPTLIDAEALDSLEKLIPLAPLHQPHNLAPIRVVTQRRPELPQVACFDTAFHRAQPELAQVFALPYAITERGVRRYGFHGLSYEYIAGVLPRYDAKAARRPRDRRASRQRRQHVRDACRPERGDHDGIYGCGWPADGHALRRDRSGRHAVSDGRAEDGCARHRETHLPAIGAARCFGDFE